ncbi:MAG: hypothetical protein WCF92_02880 [bacterium]
MNSLYSQDESFVAIRKYVGGRTLPQAPLQMCGSEAMMMREKLEEPQFIADITDLGYSFKFTDEKGILRISFERIIANPDSSPLLGARH